MNDLKKILNKDNFNRFKYIKNIINKYPINKVDITDINTIKNAYAEYTPKYTIILDHNKIYNYAKSLIFNKLSKEQIDDLYSMKNCINIIDDNLEINILYKSEIDKKIINLIFSSIKLFKKINGEKKMCIIIALSDINRKITTKIISRNNVNGGTDYDLGIKIYRKEEALKVLFHELIHYYKIDHKELDKYHSEIFEPFKIIHPENFGHETKKSIHELYTEYNAMKYHIAVVSYYTNVSPLLIYHYEKIWSLYQVCKILKHYDLNRFEDLFTIGFVEDTHVFTYYIVKFFLLWKYTNNIRAETIKNILKDQEIIKVINENMNLTFDKSLRMTFFELF
jgi:hypothetical protein